MVWEGQPDGLFTDSQIFLYDGTSTTQLTNNDYNDYSPQINDDGYVLWYGWGDGRDWEIYLYDGTSTTQLTTNDYNDYSPQINDDGYVAWYGWGGLSQEIFLAAPCGDTDGDGYYLESGCPGPLDCNDTNENVYPTNSNTNCDCQDPIPQGTTEVCSGGIDEDCDGLVDGDDPECQGYASAANAEASTYGSTSLTRSGLLNGLALLLIPAGAVILLRIVRRKK